MAIQTGVVRPSRIVLGNAWKAAPISEAFTWSPPAMMMIMPRKTASVPSVTTIGGMPRKAISAPLIMPSTRPATMPVEDHQDERRLRIILADQCREHAGQREIGGDGEVDAAGQDHHHLRQRHHEQHRRLGEQVADVLPLQEDRLIGADAPRRRG